MSEESNAINPNTMSIIVTKGSLDWAYPPFILASTAAALGYDTQIFFTFYGLQLLKKKMDVQVSPLGNPGMPMPMAMDKWFPVLGTAIPGMQSMMTMMMKNKMKSKGVASLEELRELCVEAEVRIIACQMTVDLFDLDPKAFIDGRIQALSGSTDGNFHHFLLFLGMIIPSRCWQFGWRSPQTPCLPGRHQTASGKINRRPRI